MEAWIWASSIDKGLLELNSLISSPREAGRTEDEGSNGGGLGKSKIEGKAGMLQLDRKPGGTIVREERGKLGKTLRLRDGQQH